jgi:hypothetical protein
VRVCLHCVRLVAEYQGGCPLCGSRFAARSTPRPAHGKGMAGFLDSINRDVVYSLDEAGEIHPMTWDAYEALPDSDPRLQRIFTVRALAVRERNKRLGLQDAPALLSN